MQLRKLEAADPGGELSSWKPGQERARRRGGRPRRPREARAQGGQPGRGGRTAGPRSRVPPRHVAAPPPQGPCLVDVGVRAGSALALPSDTSPRGVLSFPRGAVVPRFTDGVKGATLGQRLCHMTMRRGTGKSGPPGPGCSVLFTEAPRPPSGRLSALLVQAPGSVLTSSKRSVRSLSARPCAAARPARDGRSHTSPARAPGAQPCKRPASRRHPSPASLLACRAAHGGGRVAPALDAPKLRQLGTSATAAL